ncbi:MAG: cobalamin-binding protein [Zetaproteobacteria bacterium CG12_big_fil_rev_8_21_14_0_65_55_1124]|nr:MAG: cobalamin-binding protein [Zetaproteobacteria bacterium CG1_02_55_237]PIS19667.1 MAG: cobalamin-binding protein [Zetaproteobacteria bacterium CG08_land_8_20_14_0_20_55_17]PIW42965.1 MAG: cobalamin-binding protein [Zetaproteobacteria bacterium CG12_big_fil_rev_8_21_14_0_65_55_1124]PIY54268.1 MAG: cobalamin-binding protein [Zetaproteobacteria bacterium CG_4_10_14_0_8_um_filter_55_43]PIZ40322.1 MAG: cobalamin-binding protein [Zetaproteobacteria bacterium CG_4_10_14_0_2_um_filter_55_20]PJB
MRCLLFAAALLLASPALAAERILALTPHACEILYAIGAGSKVVGAGEYCDYPVAAGKLPRVGNFDRINVEAALRLHPDAAVVMDAGVKGVETLQGMGVSIVVSHPRSFEGVFDDIIRLGVLAEHTQEAGALVASLRARLDRVRAMKRSETPVFYEIWADPMLTAGGPSFISKLIHEAGGRNVFADIDIETPHVNVESVLRAAPEVIVVPLEGRSIEQRRTFWEGWIGKDKVRFISINPDLLHRPGPRLLDGLELLQKALSQGGVK